MGRGQVDLDPITADRDVSQDWSLAVFLHSQEAIMVTDHNNRIVDVNPAFTEITGYAREEVLGQSPNMLSSGRQSPEFYNELWSTLQSHDRWRGEIWNRRKNGEIYAEMLLSLNSLKIDESYVSEMATSARHRDIVESIIGLGKAFQLEVVAEGVETQEQRLQLLEMGCCLGQGYAIARPMPAEDFEPWLKRWKHHSFCHPTQG